MSRGPTARVLVVINSMGGMGILRSRKSLRTSSSALRNISRRCCRTDESTFRLASSQYRPEQPFSQKRIYLRIVVKMHVMYSSSEGLTVGDHRARSNLTA